MSTGGTAAFHGAYSTYLERYAGVAFGFRFGSFHPATDSWLRSPLPSGTGWDKNFQVVGSSGATFIEGTGYGYGTRVATPRSVAFGFYEALPL